jgi:hypothetical protein
MKGAILRSGIVSGLLNAAFLATIVRVLALDVPPIVKLSTATGQIERAVEWIRQAGLLAAPACILGIVVAFVYVLLSTYVTRSASLATALFAGLAVGVIIAGTLGVIPWSAFWASYSYTPAVAPLGPYHAGWTFSAIVAAGTVAGVVARLMCRVTISVSPPVVKWRQIYPKQMG